MAVQQIGELLGNSHLLRMHLLKVLFTSIILTIIAAYFGDQAMAQYFFEPEIYKIFWQRARDITNLGLSEYYFGIAIFTWLFTAWVAPRMKRFAKHSSRIDFLRRWGLNFVVALLISGIITHLLKLIVGRQRPHKSSPLFDPYIFDPFTTHWHWHSFSSGHTQVMFTAATMFCVAFPKAWWVWISIAFIICATRIMIHDHFLSDVIFGASVGYIGSLLAMKVMKEKTKNGLY